MDARPGPRVPTRSCASSAASISIQAEGEGMSLAYSVSVIVPSYNRTKFLEAALASALAQTVDDREIIVADDGSEPETRAFLRDAASRGVRVIELPHCGNPGHVRNMAIEAARGRYVAFLDSDDLWKPT